MTLIIIILFIFGVFCAWALLKAANWLPLVIAFAVTALATTDALAVATCTVVIHNTGASPLYVRVCYNDGGTYWGHNTFPGGTLGPIAAGSTASCNGAFDNTHSFTIETWVSCTSVPSACSGTSGGTASESAAALPATYDIYCTCSGPPTLYYWNNCITNNSGYPQAITWQDTAGHAYQQNLGPGQYWCMNATNNATFSAWFGGITYGNDGSTNSYWSQTPSTANSQTGGNTGTGNNTGGTPGSGGQDPTQSSGQNSTNALTGQQYEAGAQYLGNILSSIKLDTSHLPGIHTDTTGIKSDADQLVTIETTHTTQLSGVTNLLGGQLADQDKLVNQGTGTTNTLALQAATLTAATNLLRSLDLETQTGTNLLGALQSIATSNLAAATLAATILSVATNELRDLDTNIINLQPIIAQAGSNNVNAVQANTQTISNQLSTVNSNLQQLASLQTTNAALFWASNGISALDTNSPGQQSNNMFSVALSNSLYSWGTPFDADGLTNFSARQANNSLWVIHMHTNLSAALAAGRGYAAGPHPMALSDPPAIDLDPRNSQLFLDTTSYMRLVETWLIFTLTLWEIRQMMSKRAREIFTVPSAMNKESDYWTVTARIIIWGSLIVAFPQIIAVIAYSFLNWPGHIGTPVSPLGSAAFTGSSPVWALMMDAIDICFYLCPIQYLLGSVLYLGIVWLGLDSATVFLMFKLKWI